MLSLSGKRMASLKIGMSLFWTSNIIFHKFKLSPWNCTTFFILFAILYSTTQAGHSRMSGSSRHLCVSRSIIMLPRGHKVDVAWPNGHSLPVSQIYMEKDISWRVVSRYVSQLSNENFQSRWIDNQKQFVCSRETQFCVTAVSTLNF